METIFLTVSFIGIILLILTPLVKTGTLVALGSIIAYFYFAGVEGWMPILLIIIGLMLVVVEVFIPDFGLIGLLGVGSIALGIYYTVGDVGLMIRDLSIALVTSTLLVFILIRNGYSFTNFNKIVLETSCTEFTEIEESEVLVNFKVGMTGIAVYPRRPSGKVVFNDQKVAYDVLSTEGHIARDSKVVIHEIHGTKIVVRKDY